MIRLQTRQILLYTALHTLCAVPRHMMLNMPCHGKQALHLRWRSPSVQHTDGSEWPHQAWLAEPPYEL